MKPSFWKIAATSLAIICAILSYSLYGAEKQNDEYASQLSDVNERLEKRGAEIEALRDSMLYYESSIDYLKESNASLQERAEQLELSKMQPVYYCTHVQSGMVAEIYDLLDNGYWPEDAEDTWSELADITDYWEYEDYSYYLWLKEYLSE